MQAAYADVAALFAAAAAAEAEGAASPAAPAASQTATDSNDRVQLRLSYGADDAVAVQLARAAPASPATPEALAAEPARAASSAGPELDLEWQLRLVPAPDGEGMVAVLVPVEAAAAIASSAGGEAGTEQAASSSPGDVSSSSGGGISEASVEAVVEAARFMHHQLNELKADVANAHLAMLKGVWALQWAVQQGRDGLVGLVAPTLPAMQLLGKAAESSKSPKHPAMSCRYRPCRGDPGRRQRSRVRAASLPAGAAATLQHRQRWQRLGGGGVDGCTVGGLPYHLGLAEAGAAGGEASGHKSAKQSSPGFW